MGSTEIDNHPFEGIVEGQLETGSILQDLFVKDPHPDKVNLLRGAYQADVGTPFVPPSTILAREKLFRDSSWHHDYLFFLGAQGLLKAGEELFFGPQSSAITSQLVASMQAVGATGAIHMGGRFLKDHYPAWKGSDHKIYLSKDTWVNHRNVFRTLDIQPIELPYYDPSTKSLNWTAFKDSIASLPTQSVVLLQTAAHNPTGCDPTPEQWKELIQIFLARRHFAFLDAAYLGLVSGDPDVDANTIRLFEAAGVPLLLAGTFGKSFGLYGERVGMLSVIAPSPEIKARMQKQMTLLARSETGSSPAFGARIVETVWGDEAIKKVWIKDVKGIADELRRRRQTLKDELARLGTPGKWDFLTQQVGMFSYLDFTPTQLEFLRTENHLYLDGNTRLSFAAINNDGITLVARGIDNMIRNKVE
ncbi:hypothetical protein NUU61_005130 [Penicillium alfredii]|uniref:Aminotransferase class I/classII large domain-containing protein n=1 Tax=Penicillium alfredii TaxID=1506179 RepID=A0A9W9K7B1_9EURO|nr:uncharacterized protein NUU61_005130 [Penicillium alfredii]KAJ5095774.1 hypothetical protein NUU61_005130 [Penicillium alfredii]